MMRKSTPRYLMWYDDNPKTPLVKKIEQAIHAYSRRFAHNPNIVLVNTAEVAEYQGVNIQCVDFVRRNNFWVGFDANLEA
jgi:capsid portal protein